MNISKDAVKKWTKRIGLGLAALVVLFLVGLSIWVFRPLKEVPPWKFMPVSTFSFFSLNLDPTEPGMSALLDHAKEKLITEETGGMKAFLFQKALPSFIPKRIVGLISLDEVNNNPQVLIVVSMGKAIRLLKLARRPFDRMIFDGTDAVKVRADRHSFKIRIGDEDGMKPNAYTVVGNNLILSTNSTLLEESYRVYTRALHGNAEEEYLSGLLLQVSSQRGGSLCVDNSQGRLSKIFQTIEEKYAFAAFPSIDAVSTIMGDLQILPEELKGSLTFYCDVVDRMPEVHSDVKFIYGALRRKARASEIDMKGNVSIQGNSVEFDFTFPNFTSAIFKGEE